MGAVQHKTTMPFAPEDSSFSFKPYKFTLFSYDSVCGFHNINRIENSRNSSPKPRSGHRIVCDNMNMYSFGGHNPSLSSEEEADLDSDGVWAESKPLFRELWKYNISTASWTKLVVENIPDILASNAVLDGRVLIVYGGTRNPLFLGNCSKDLYICNLGSGEQTLQFSLISATGNCPQPQYGQATVLINNYLYTVGGKGSEYTCDIHRLNLKDVLWEAVYTCKGTDNEPAGRYGHEIAFDGSKIYVLGGGTARREGPKAFDFQVIFAFNLSYCAWEKITTRPDDKAREAYPTPRRDHSCVQHEQYAYIIGGFSGDVILKDIWRLDFKTFEWKKFPLFSLDRGLYFHSSCLTSNGKMITFGGIVQSENSSKRSAAVHSAWLCIPKLKEICWEAVMFYHPQLTSLTETELINIGVPFEFIERLDLKK